MKDNLSWIIAGGLALIGIGAFVVFGSGVNADEINSAVSDLNSTAKKGVHSSSSTADLKKKRDQAQDALNAHAEMIAKATRTSALENYAEVLKVRSDNSVKEGTDFLSQQWGVMGASFTESLEKLYATTQEPPSWDVNGLLNPRKGSAPDVADTRVAPSLRMDTFGKFIMGLKRFPNTKGNEEANENYVSKLAIVAMDQVMKGMERAIAKTEADKRIFEVTDMRFDSGAGNAQKYGKEDPFHRWDFSIDLSLSPEMVNTMRQELINSFAAIDSPRIREIEIQIMQGSVPAGAKFALTRERLDELLLLLPEAERVPYPKSDAELPAWNLETWPKLQALERKNGNLSVPLTTDVRLTFELMVQKEDSTAFNLDAAAKPPETK